MTVLYMMAGLPGSGKSTLARALYNTKANSVLYQSDVIRRNMYSNPTYLPEESESVFNEMKRLVEDSMKNGINDIIVEATFLSRWSRRDFNRIAERYGAKICLVHVETAENIILERLKNRVDDINMSQADVAVYERMKKKNFQEPNHVYCSVSGSNPVEHNLHVINMFTIAVLKENGFLGDQKSESENSEVP